MDLRTLGRTGVKVSPLCLGAMMFGKSGNPDHEDLAIAFVIRHPAVTAAIIGPRTMEQLESQIGAAEISLDNSLLDRIDEIVPPGTNVDPDDTGWRENPALQPSARRG